MLPHEDTIRLRHMLDAATEAGELVCGKARADLDQERILALALVRLLEVLGEAAGRVTKRSRAQYPEIPWRQIIALRNRLIHGYDSVDLDILWVILTDDLPPLISALDDILSSEQA